MAQNELLKSHQLILHSFQQERMACTAAELCCLFMVAACQVKVKCTDVYRCSAQVEFKQPVFSDIACKQSVILLQVLLSSTSVV